MEEPSPSISAVTAAFPPLSLAGVDFCVNQDPITYKVAVLSISLEYLSELTVSGSKRDGLFQSQSSLQIICCRRAFLNMESLNKKLQVANMERKAEKDFISKLPDHLLHEILLKLHAKEAVQTSILSKRWRYVWLTSPLNLNLRYDWHVI